MGNSLVNSLFKGLWPKEVKIIIVGLDAAGKTTLLYKMKLGEVVQTIPTIGLNIESIQYKNINMMSWDVGGRDGGLRALRRHYYQFVDAVVFVVDSNDRERIDEARESLEKILTEEELKNLPFLVYANKQDLPNAMSVSEITDKLGLHSLKNRAWYIQSSCMTSGDGIYEGLDWLTHTLRSGFLKKPFAETPTGDAIGQSQTTTKKRWALF